MDPFSGAPSMQVKSSAPVRICDLGGWTDTWFAEHGELLNIAISPRIEVHLTVYPDQESPVVVIQSANYQDRYLYRPGSGWHKQPLLEAAIDSLPIPPSTGLEISISSEMPPGASTGTSASVVVALLAALDCLTAGRKTPHELAYTAWRVETEKLDQQSGVQDQLAAAYGGINWIEMPAFPEAGVTQLDLPAGTLQALEERLALVYLGKAHQSTRVHEMVIRRLEKAGPQAEPLPDLRQCAQQGREALHRGDLDAFGGVMTANHEAQRRLHPALINPLMDQVAGIANRFGAAGWKANGAGGEGGSLTVLGSPDSRTRSAMGAAIQKALPVVRFIPIHLSGRGVVVEVD